MLVTDRPNDRQTDIATFRAAIAAKSEEFDGEYSSLQLPKDSWVCCHHKEQCSTQVDSNIHLLVVVRTWDKLSPDWEWALIYCHSPTPTSTTTSTPTQRKSWVRHGIH